MNIPNILTLARIAFIPLLVVLFYLPFAWSMPLAAALFALASATDWLDGYLARRWNQSTPFGAFLDPVADKLMVAVALALMIERYEAIWLTLPALVIIGREIVISALREWMAEMGKRGQVAVSWVGKVKTTLQMVAIFLLLAARQRPRALSCALGQSREQGEHAVLCPVAAAGGGDQILAHGEGGEDLPSLRHQPDAGPRDAVGRQPVEALSVQRDRAPARRGEAQDGADGRRLAHAVAAEQRRHRAGGGLQVDAKQHLARPVEALHAAEAQHQESPPR